ncbi:DNA helicase HerA, contains HAS-barrel and ATPase domains [Lachnospiraceae bacterium]|nr:DNA helicase HerA, contains HAS-barrel and ATPase domains [Lachnospiraceae bacterium]
MDELKVRENEDLAIVTEPLTMENRLEIIEEGIRKKYLARLTEMQICPINNMLPLEEDLIDNIRVYKVTEMVYPKDEIATDKFTTVFNTLSTYNASIFIILDSDGEKTDFYIGVRNNETDPLLKRSTVTLGDTMKNTLIGHFPGAKIENIDRNAIANLSNKIITQDNVASVSVVGSTKNDKEQSNNQFVQGIEKLALSMHDRQYIGIIIAENQSSKTVQSLREDYQNLYTKLSPFQKVQFSDNTSESTSRNKSFSEMSGKQKAAMIGGAVISVIGAVGGAALGAVAGGGTAAGTGAMVGGTVAGQFNGFISSLAPTEQISTSTSTTTSTTTENKAVTDIMQLLDESIQKTKEYDSYGMWNIASYFISDDMTAAEIAASNYRSLMNGEKSGRELSAINSWRSNNPAISGGFRDLTTYLSRFMHPTFCYGSNEEYNVLTDATTSVSGRDLGLHMGLPRATVSGLPVIEHAEFGKEVTTYQLFSNQKELRPEERLTLGKVFDLGRITNKVVELENKSLNMHTFITGSTGSGKSNTVYQILSELHQDNIPFLVIEPAKGEYKDVFGHMPDVNVFSTNPNVSELINLNPFKFPSSIHVLEHVDGLVEIFSACWPMYDAMPAFFKDAMLKSYESVGWDLGSSTFDGEDVEFPDFEILAEQLNELIEGSDYASDIKSNYRGALITRVKSLSVGLNKFIFTSEQTPYERIFDENCILDISRVKSGETKALIMGMMVYILNEYRVDRKTSNNNGLKHITVLEEAHNLLKNTANGESELVGKSVEMLTQTIAEIRTYGEGFIIVDQSPSSVDISAIKNTNTKIVLRTPEANDREAVGRSMGLTENQVNEIAKLPGGVAVVYQNNWVNPVLTLVDKAPVKDVPYVNENPIKIRTIKSARKYLLKMLMHPWIGGEEVISEEVLLDSLKVIELSRSERKEIKNLISDYGLFAGNLIWKDEDMAKLQQLVKSVLGISDKDISHMTEPKDLYFTVKDSVKKLSDQEIKEICYVITYTKEVA